MPAQSPDSIRIADERTLIAVKIETAKGVENVNEIISVPGIDIAFLGHMDLSVSLGTPGRYDTPRFRDCADQVIAAAKRHGKTAACLVTSPDAARSGWPGATGLHHLLDRRDPAGFGIPCRHRRAAQHRSEALISLTKG